MGSAYDNGLEPSGPRAVSGVIVFHDGLRSWFGLRPDAPVCGQSEFEILLRGRSGYDAYTRYKIETSRDCKATITGRLSFADPINYPDTIFLKPDKVVPDQACTPKPEFPDVSKLRPEPNVQNYDVKLTVSLIGDGSIRAVARNQGRLLQPWQAYLSYSMNNRKILSATCGYGFVVSNVSGTPEVGPSTMAYDAVMDIRVPQPNITSCDDVHLHQGR